MLVQLLFIFILAMPALGLVFLGLALSSGYRKLVWISFLGILVFGLSFYSLHLKNDVFFYSFFILGPFLFGLGLPLNLTKPKRIQAGFSGFGIIVVFFLALLIIAQMLNRF
ncbi:hypothetical protein ACFSN5_09280 [Streptococcus tangpeifui]|uniref:hypothetical protein n=1 Tax=Streptococcus tangpeifui TaxID=2709400 RepID=UPI0013ED4CB8|nr:MULTISPECIES: hypothetical protein [unclassified Streptococcus]